MTKIYDPAKLDNKIFKNLQDILWSHEVLQKYHEKLENGSWWYEDEG